MMKDPLVACHDCDLLQRLPPLAPREQACCQRCSARLTQRTQAPHHTLAYVVAALTSFTIGNFYPVISLQSQGLQTHATLLGTAQVLYVDHMGVVAALILLTGFIAPLLLLTSLIYLLLPLQFGYAAPGFTLLFRIFLAISPWAMIEVMMLGIVVSLVKLAGMASAVSGIGLWSFGATMLLMAAISGSLDQEDIWHRFEAARNRHQQQKALA